MRHKVYGKKLGRDKNQRTALFRGLIRSLLLEESIQTTQPKAKAIKGLVDKLITAGRKNTSATRRVIESALPQYGVSRKLIEEIAPRYKDRTSGFTQVVRLGRRTGDGAMMVRMSLIPEKKKAEKEKKQTGAKAKGRSPRKTKAAEGETGR